MSALPSTERGSVHCRDNIYRGYLQIAALDMLHGASLIHAIIWDPTQEIATRPLAIRENGVWYTYGWDLTKNICELYGQEGFIRTIYTYSPYGQVTAEGDVQQPIQWSSEYHDEELQLVYYNYRYYNPQDGRWTRRDPLGIQSCVNPYNVVENKLTQTSDYLGLVAQSSLQTPDGIRVALRIAEMTGSGIIGGVTAKMLGDECVKPNTFSKPDTFEVECTRKCKSKKEGKTCKDTKGKGKRKGSMVCRAGLLRNTWEFAEWVEKGHDCNAAKCDSCCESVRITYASKP